MVKSPSLQFVVPLLSALLLSANAPGQSDLVAIAPVDREVQPSGSTAPRFASTLVVPQRHAFRLAEEAGQLRVVGVDAWATVVGRAASTTLSIQLVNPTDSQEEAELVLPVPPGSVIKEFAFDGPLQGVTASLLERDDARRLYEGIVSRMRDPALLEFAGQSFIRSSVFPVPARGRQTLRVSYDEVLVADGCRVDYVLPRSTSPLSVWTPWTVHVRIKGDGPVTSVYSPSHELEVKRLRADSLWIEVPATPPEAAPTGPFVLSYLTQTEGAASTFMACPDDESSGGYFLMLADFPKELLASDDPPAPRDVTFVLDRSGSMNGGKLDQAREAALQVIEGLSVRDTWQILDYADAVGRFADVPQSKSPETVAAAREYLGRLTPTGGTNLHGALLEALRQPSPEGALSMVLFLTDGLPTVGVEDESRIRSEALDGNAFGKRVFTFGVGHDVNAPLLDALASGSSARSSYVQPDEDVEVEVARVFRRLTGPVLAGARLEITTLDGEPAAAQVSELQPSRLDDIYAGDQLMLLGKYSATEPLRFRIAGRLRSVERHFDSTFDPVRAAVAKGFVPRLWASRKTAALIDEVRQAGATPGQPMDARSAEVVEEIVALSTEFGVLTEYTSFFAEEGTDLSRPAALRKRVRNELRDRAQRVRSGRHAVSQAMNIRSQRRRRSLASSQGYLDADMRQVRIEGIQHVNSRTFFKREKGWVDAAVARRRMIGADAGAESESESESGAGAGAETGVAATDLVPVRVVVFGTREHFDLARRLAAEGTQAALAMRGDLVLRVDGETVVVRPAAPIPDPVDG